jgi:AcrR family transcriptional regulator
MYEMADSMSTRGRNNGSRERLLVAAADLVTTRGYAATSVEAITSRAGVVKSALYGHFRNKEELIAAALERRATEWVEHVEKAVGGAADPAQRLSRLLELTRDTVRAQSPPVRMLYTMLAERGGKDPLLRRSVAHIFERLRSSVIQDLSKRLQLPPERFEDLALVLVSALHGVLFDHLANPDEAWLERWLEAIGRMITVMLEHELKRDSR